MTLTLTNVDEPGSIGPITGIAQVEQELTAGTVTDLDSPSTPVTITRYQWQDASGGANIRGANDATYTLAATDEGKTIQVMVTYTDGEGPNKTTTSTATGAVVADDVVLSTDANLSALTIADNDGNAVDLNETFEADVITYTADVGNDVASATLTPTTSDTNAIVTVDSTRVNLWASVK